MASYELRQHQQMAGDGQHRHTCPQCMPLCDDWRPYSGLTIYDCAIGLVRYTGLTLISNETWPAICLQPSLVWQTYRHLVVDCEIGWTLRVSSPFNYYLHHNQFVIIQIEGPPRQREKNRKLKMTNGLGKLCTLQRDSDQRKSVETWNSANHPVFLLLHDHRRLF